MIVFTLIFLLNVFGCTDEFFPYAISYGYVIVIGLPFMMIGTTLNSIIRADGNPKYAMKSMLIGAILNIILDPVFIFVFKMGVKGAAIATVISQIVTFIINILYIKKFKSIVFFLRLLTEGSSLRSMYSDQILSFIRLIVGIREVLIFDRFLRSEYQRIALHISV